MEGDLIPGRRRTARSQQRMRAECRIDGKLWLGTIHDFNAKGAFFQPELCLTDGERMHPEDAWMVAGGDEPIALKLVEPANDQVFEGSVRWSGCSDIHRCSGLGLAFAA